jgi:hypothetical protein
VTATDIRYGRRGGNWVPDGHDPTDRNWPPCDVCGRPMACRQRHRHYSCTPLCACGCGWPVAQCRPCKDVPLHGTAA